MIYDSDGEDESIMCYDHKSATPQDNAILMCIERINRLEEEIQMLKEGWKRDIQRETIIRDIVLCDDRKAVSLDLLFYFLGIPYNERADVFLERHLDLVRNVLPKYSHKTETCPTIIRMAEILQVKGKINIVKVDASCYTRWNSINTEVEAANIVSFLKTLTTQELEGFWEWRMLATKWMVRTPNVHT